MATDEEQSSNPIPAPPQPAIPPYPEMILAAIDALGEKEGSNKTSISKHIESTYTNLSPAHSTLLTHHLNRMKTAGQLVFLKNNYLRPDPNAPPRRGRGRPPKPKTPLPAGHVPPPPRSRGRPPKDPNDPASPKPVSPKPAGSVSGRKRGRPPKAGGPATPKPVTPAASGGGTPRGRGRPPKVKAVAAAPVGA